MAQQGLEPRLQEQCTINTTGLFLIQISSSILFYVLNLVLVIIPYDKNHLRYICPLIFSFSCKLSFCESYYPVNSFGKYESQWIKFRKLNNFFLNNTSLWLLCHCHIEIGWISLSYAQNIFALNINIYRALIFIL